MTLQGTTTLVVGGSSGIGLATALAVQLQGGHVLLAGRDQERLRAAQFRLNAEGNEVHIFSVDVTAEPDVRDLLLLLPRFDHLVSTAGAGWSGQISSVHTHAARAAFDGKFWSKVFLAKYAASKLPTGGSITFVSGTLGERPAGGAGITSAANAAVNALVKTLALELAPLRVNAVSPGLIATEAYASMTAEARDAMYQRAAATLPVGRVGRPEDVAQVITMLMLNPFVTGSVVSVNGGATL